MENKIVKTVANFPQSFWIFLENLYKFKNWLRSCANSKNREIEEYAVKPAFQMLKRK